MRQQQATHPLIALATAVLILVVAYWLYAQAAQLTAVNQPSPQVQPLVIQLPQTAVNPTLSQPTVSAPIQPNTAVNSLILDLVPTTPATVQQPTAVQNQQVQPATIAMPTLLPDLAAACEAARTAGRRQSPKCQDIVNEGGR